MLVLKERASVNRNKFLIVLLIWLCSSFCYSQEKEAKEEKDSLKIYKKIKELAYKFGLTKRLYENVFVDPDPKEYPVNPASGAKKNVNPYLKHNGKIIRNINITVYDPFGHSVSDTNKRSIKYFERVGNRAHFRTRTWIIANRLLFKQNDKVNALSLSESERLLREAIFINDARIFVSKINGADSVDVNVIVLDKWTITMPVLITDVSASARFRNQNLFGLGQQFQQYARFKKPDMFEYSGLYNISNIDNKFISSQLGYQTDASGTTAYLNFDRPFFSPLVKIAWGAGVNNSWRYFSYTDSIDSIPRRCNLDILGYDIWASRTFKLETGKSFFNQSTNIIVGARHYNRIFLERPSFEIDKNRSNGNSMAFIGNAGFAVQQYYKDKYIYRFGANEDVPEGLIMQFIYGGLKPEFSKVRYYVGAEVARAKHFNFGYLAGTFSYGIFFNNKVTNDITTNFKLDYFSNLLRKEKWFFRQFFNYNIVHGQNKIGGETITLSSQELYGFQSQSLAGNTKMVFNSETVAYAPYKFIGFRFAPVFQVGLGMVGDPLNKLKYSRLYQGYTLGLMVRNENLLSSTFQFSIGMYPFFPDGDNYTFIYNPVTSFTLRVRAFTVSRPEFVNYF